MKLQRSTHVCVSTSTLEQTAVQSISPVCNTHVNGSTMSSPETTTNNTEYPDRVHECLKYVPIYSKGAFSCSTIDDDDDDDEDDEDVKRILTDYGELEPKYCETIGFSSAYKAAAAEANLSSVVEGLTIDDNYKDWEEALKDVSAVYPPLGVGRAVSKSLGIQRLDDLTSKVRNADCDYRLAGDPTARELRKCLEGALYGLDSKDFVVTQPYCVANKNLDFGKPKISHNAIHASRKKVENWMIKYIEDEDMTTTTAMAYH